MRLRQQFVIGAIDQAALSLCSFFVGIYLINNASKAAYGLYVLGFALLLFGIGLHNALITTQMTVLHANKCDSRHGFCSALASGQYTIFLPMVALLGIAAVSLEYLGWITQSILYVVIAALVALLGVMLREFSRSFFFVNRRLGAVLGIDAIYIVLVLVGLATAGALFRDTMNLAAIAALGVASLIAGLVGLWMAGLYPAKSMSAVSDALGSTWAQGKWASLGVVVTMIQGQSYVYLLTAIGGPEQTADVNATILLMMPVSLLTVTTARILLPRWSALRATGDHHRIVETARLTLGALAVAIALYTAMIAFAHESITTLVLTHEYSVGPVMIILCGAVFLAQSVRSNFSLMLQAYEKFRVITIVNSVTAVVVVLAGVALISAYGGIGSLMAMLVGEILLVVLLGREVRYVAKS